MRLGGIGQPQLRNVEETVRANRQSPCRESYRRAGSGERKRKKKAL
jgi:hypothetical protein